MKLTKREEELNTAQKEGYDESRRFGPRGIKNPYTGVDAGKEIAFNDGIKKDFDQRTGSHWY